MTSDKGEDQTTDVQTEVPEEQSSVNWWIVLRILVLLALAWLVLFSLRQKGSAAEFLDSIPSQLFILWIFLAELRLFMHGVRIKYLQTKIDE
jgi:hypothetical protein